MPNTKGCCVLMQYPDCYSATFLIKKQDINTLQTINNKRI